MQRVEFWFDPGAPDVRAAQAAFSALPRALTGLSYEVAYRPVPMAPAPPGRHAPGPSPLLRLVQAAGPSRRVVEAVLQHAAQGDAHEPGRLAALAARLAVLPGPATAEVVRQLDLHADAARRAGVVELPSFGTGGRLFSGPDALAELAAVLRRSAGQRRGAGPALV